MKIGIISDTHGYPSKWKKITESFFKDVDLILHAGDLLYHGPRNPILAGYDPKELSQIVNSSEIPILISKGNCDCDVDQMITTWPILSPFTLVQDGNIRILTIHGYKESDEELLQMANNFKVNLLITGHTHVRRLERHDNLIWLNPGSVALPKDSDGIPSIALLENGLIKILDANTGDIISSIEI